MRLEIFLDELCTPLFHAASGVANASAAVRRAQDENVADYQLNGALAVAKQAGKKPRDIAEEVVRQLEAKRAEDASFPIQRLEIAGPGFINVTLDPAWLAGELGRSREQADLGIGAVAQPEKIVIDFSGPNVAKEMHIGHIRSTILGDTLARLFTAVGHEVVRDNHLGDWGTQFGLLIHGLNTFGGMPAENDGNPGALADLEVLYRRSSEAAKADPAFAEAARAELAKLQSGDATNLALWKRFVQITRSSLETIYDELDIHFDTWLGESSYNDALAGVVATLEEKAIAREDQGALCVFLAEHEVAADLKRIKEPFIVRKKDGAFLYSTTDLATAIYREDELRADRAVYVVDARQALHFKQLFATLQLLGRKLACEHVSFGSILGKGGTPLKTREGNTISLRSVLDEATERAHARIREEGLDVSEEELAEVARRVGIGAVKYADLRQNRSSDYVFDWDKMIAFKGSAGPTIQYAYARIASLLRKAEVTQEAALQATAPRLEAAQERALGLLLLRYADVVHEAARTRSPHLVCEHLYALTRAFSSFYEACPVLRADDEAQKISRLALTALTGKQLAQGLGLLGIATVERM